jgi:hypothetical protein
MSTRDDLWRLEEKFWLGGGETFHSTMADGAIIVFAYPAGILQGDSARKGVSGQPKWRSVVMADRTVNLKGDVAVLAYRAEAERPDAPILKALCASTYVRDEGTWRLMSHQQTPV